MIETMRGTVVRSALALAICAGFVALAVFGLAIAGHSGDGSLLSCVAASAGLVCDPHQSGASTQHDAAAYRAVTNSAHSLYAALSAALAAVAVMALSAFGGLVAPRAPLAYAAHSDGASLSYPSVARLRRWLSLFESSPGR